MAALVALALAALPAVSVAFPAGSFEGSQPRGKAYGAKGELTHASLPKVSVGEVATQTMPCNPALGAESAKTSDELINHVDLLDVVLPTSSKPVLVKGAKIRNTGSFDASQAQADVFEKSTLAELAMLDGRIRAKAVEARAHTTLSSAGTDHHTTIDDLLDPPGVLDGSTASSFQELVIDPDGAGPDPELFFSGDDVAPNTKVFLKDIGYVVLNEQRPTPRGGWEVNALHVYIFDDPATAATESFFGYSGDVLVAHAETRLDRATGRLSGYSHATSGNVSPFLQHGRQAFLGINCGGSKGEERVLTQAGFDTGPGPSSAFSSLLRSNSLRSTVQGDVLADSVFSRSTHTVEGLRIFTDTTGFSRIKADAVKSVARTDGNNSSVTSSGVDTTFLNLKIDRNGDGVYDDDISGSAPPNTKIPLGGLGHIILNEWRCRNMADPTLGSQSCSSIEDDQNPPQPVANTHYNKLIVTGILVRITVPGNPAGLPVGAEFRVAVAESDASF